MGSLNDSNLLTGNFSKQNITEDNASPTAVTYISLVLHILIACTSLIGNGIVIRFFCTKQTRTNAVYFSVVLAFTDVLLAIWWKPFTTYNGVVNCHWIVGHFMCSKAKYVYTACVIQHSCTLVAYSIDRYVAIRWPFKKATSLLVAVEVAAIIVVALLLPLPLAIYTNIEYPDESDSASGICMEVWPRNDLRLGFDITLVTVTFFIPLLVLAITYGHIIYILGAKPPGDQYETLTKRRQAIRKKTIRVFLLTFFTYAICKMPIHSLTIASDIIPHMYDTNPMQILWLFARCLAVSNSAIYPGIVIMSNSEIQKHIKARCCSPDLSKGGKTPKNWV